MRMERKHEVFRYLDVALSRKTERFLTMKSNGKTILSVPNLEQLLGSFISRLSDAFDINRALIMLVNEDGDYLAFAHGMGFGGCIPEEVRKYKVPLSRRRNILARVTHTGRPEYVRKGRHSRQRKEDIWLNHVSTASVYVAPLITRFKVIGVIAVDASGNKKEPEQSHEALRIFAQQIAMAIENASLHSRLKEQDMELKKSQAMLSRAQRLSFLGNQAARLAHEIKNPMTAIQTFIQVLPRKFNDEEFRKNFYEILMEETSRVNNLITELLDLVKMKRPGFEFVDLHALIEKMIFLISPQSHAKKIEIVREFDPGIGMVWIDSAKIKQVILNLLSNAVEFTDPGGYIKLLTRECTRIEKPRRIRIEIIDNGMGIDASIITKIFDPYFTFKRWSDIHQGTGLGLFVSHQSIKELGGAIEVKSQLDHGTTFILTLPADPPKKKVRGMRNEA